MSVAESALLANAVTKGLFNTDIQEFLTGKVNGQYKPGADGSTVLTLPELLGAGKGGIGGNYSAGWDLQSVLKHNLQENGARMLMSLVLVPVAFRMGSSLLRKPRRQANALLKQVGVTGVKV